ncbi:MAG: copper chaperone PCu(A)C [Alphaproteobacteria bacterium]|nr:copper chaperone PCu(A)C [Alphaproteobacteria bacterium]
MFRTLFLTALMCAATLGAQAHDYNLGDLKIVHPWARATAPSAPAGGAFLTIVNGGASDKLLSASADVSNVVELHTHITEGNVVRMRKVENIDLAGGSETKLAPGGLHVMLIGLKAPLKEGATFPLTLTFERSGSITVEVNVQGLGAATPSHGADAAKPMDHKSMDHKQH